MRLAIFTHVVHQLKASNYVAYSPSVREMKVWMKQFGKVEIVAPVYSGSDDLPGLEYEHPHLNFTEITSFNFLGLKSSIRAIVRIPGVCYKIARAMKRADHLHLRCPGNVGLLASVLQVFFPKKMKTAKYAGNWDPGSVQPWSYKLQGWILNNAFLTRNMRVLVYGKWPGQSKNIRPFYTASFSEKDIVGVPEKEFLSPFVFLFVGNLVEGKGVLAAIKLIRGLKERGIGVSLRICGDGPEREMLKNYCKVEEMERTVHFTGNLSLKDLKEEYWQAHFLILPSRSEGWPKAVAEAMFFGCIPIATQVSCVPWMLGEGERGLLFNFDSDAVEEIRLINTITELLNDPCKMKKMSKAAKKWSQQYTLEKFELGIRTLLQKEKDEEVLTEEIYNCVILKKDLRVLQVIDSLRPGGAEQMAVSYANALIERLEGSFLCCTRLEGVLQKKLDAEVGYLFLNKKFTFSIRAFLKLRRFVIKERINLIQAHGSSFFLAVFIKLSLPEVRLLWQDHNNKGLKGRKLGFLVLASYLFDGVISVNERLKRWSLENLKTSNIIYIKNFLPNRRVDLETSQEKLTAEGSFRIIHLANLRPQKDHINLIKAFQLVLQKNLDVSLHLVGLLEKNRYMERVMDYIRRSDLEGKVFIYDQVENPQQFLKDSDLGVLSSNSEGFPLALLEYGQAGLPVVCTEVGECAEILSDKGKLVPPEDPEALATAMDFYIRNPLRREEDATEFQAHILQEFTEEKVLPEILEFFDSVFKKRNSFRWFESLPMKMNWRH